LSDKHLYNLHEINIDQVAPNRYQPRQTWNEDDLKDLAESIKAKGVIQPIVVRKAASGFELIAGERRLRAAKLAGLAVLPAIVRPATDQEMLEIALIENISRTDLNPIEKARAYKNYVITFNISHDEAAARLGQSRPVITNYLRLLDLPDEIQQMLVDGQISMGHARAILSLPTDDLRRKLANRAMAGRLSVREVERLVRKYITGSETSNRPLPVKPPHIIDLENRLTKVSIETRKNGNRGKIIIEFYSIDDFDRITEQIGLNSQQQL
jgi:ParB family chromosome partitioning protein